MRKPIVAANWKMHAPPQGWDTEDSPFRPREDIDVIVFPTLLDLHSCLEKFLTVGAQYGRPEAHGAFTGDVSMQLLAQHGCRYALCGHSERRQQHVENDEFIAKQLEAAIDAGLMPILCIGETADERELGQAKDVIKRQLGVHDPKLIAQSIIAYEPVWAIGTGNTASKEDAQEMHAFIRSLFSKKQGASMHIIYGGSVKPANASALIAQPDIDGFLVGGSSLDAEEFRKIVDACMVES